MCLRWIELQNPHGVSASRFTFSTFTEHNEYLVATKNRRKLKKGREENLQGREITRREWGKARVGKLGFGKLGETFQLWMGSKNNSTRLAHSLLSNSALAARLIHTSSFSFLFFLFFYFAFNPHTRPLLFIYPPYDDVARDRRSLHKMYTNFSYDFIPHSARHCV